MKYVLRWLLRAGADPNALTMDDHGGFSGSSFEGQDLEVPLVFLVWDALIADADVLGVLDDVQDVVDICEEIFGLMVDSGCDLNAVHLSDEEGILCCGRPHTVVDRMYGDDGPLGVPGWGPRAIPFRRFLRSKGAKGFDELSTEEKMKWPAGRIAVERGLFFNQKPDVEK